MRFAPLFRVLLPFAVGIILAVAFGQLLLFFSISAFVSFLACYLFFNIFIKHVNQKYTWLSGLFMSGAFVFLGITYAILRTPSNSADYFTKQTQKGDLLLVRLTEPLTEKPKTYKTIGEASAIIRGNTEIKTGGNILLYFYQDSTSHALHYGDFILMKPVMKRMQAAGNPEEFDYAQYMRWQGIDFEAFVKKGDWKRTGESSVNPFMAAVYSFRTKAGNYFNESLKDTNIAAVAKALILGETDELSPELKGSYIGTGTIHILCVAGLHVGIVYISALFLFSFLLRVKYGKYLLAGIILSILWSYAAIAAFTPSVCRAVMMFSIVLIGRTIRRDMNVFNSLAASALILLLFDPYMITRAGFQFSFIAVAGIVWLQPKIFGLWEVNNPILRFFWQLAAVSLAAQISVLPLGLYYYNQFPTYFLISNLAVVPLAPLIMASGCVFLLFRFMGLQWLGFVTSKILYALIYSVNWIISGIKNFPNSLYEGYYLTIFECIILYTIILLLCWALVYKNKTSLVLSLSLLLFYSSNRAINQYSANHSAEIVAYNIPHSHLISYKVNDSLYLAGDSSILTNHDKVKMYTYRYAFKNFVPKENIVIANNSFAFKTSLLTLPGNRCTRIRLR